ncbi:hypothetical protein FIBSPDRAFT_937024 [Athelia psychrophila]|uniref:Uncharacterized protein n=1 Tax=Athelia psychrophila TaxID=1759441 RepID=A0A166B3T1_9AGAM|nr:hypothetical protein FIBSPDRAFT_937024 [Fibularhizoctonia sp. CBS 109695]
MQRNCPPAFIGSNAPDTIKTVVCKDSKKPSHNDRATGSEYHTNGRIYDEEVLCTRIGIKVGSYAMRSIEKMREMRDRLTQQSVRRYLGASKFHPVQEWGDESVRRNALIEFHTSTAFRPVDRLQAPIERFKLRYCVFKLPVLSPSHPIEMKTHWPNIGLPECRRRETSYLAMTSIWTRRWCKAETKPLSLGPTLLMPMTPM